MVGSIILAITMVFTMMPLVPLSGRFAYAEISIGSITVDGTTTQYTEYRPLKLALEKLKNKEVTVEMLTDWDNSIAGMTVGERAGNIQSQGNSFL